MKNLYTALFSLALAVVPVIQAQSLSDLATLGTQTSNKATSSRNQGDPNISASDKALYQQALAAQNSRQFKKAADLYLKISQQTKSARFKSLSYRMAGSMYTIHGNLLIQQGKGAEAVPFLTKGASMGETGAYAILGTMYYVGQGVTPNPQKAIEFYRKGARLGEPNAQQALRSLRLRW